jgi:UDP:flavonoid glycosyltransferase YjiC (YdhE family)
VDETGLGVRLSTYGFKDEELTGAVDRLLGNPSLRARMHVMSARIKATSGTARAADLIEGVAMTGEPVSAA